MLQMNYSEILQATGGILVAGDMNGKITGISTDSRKITYGELFIPLIGDCFDGHDYIATAFTAGAAAVLTQKDIDTFSGKTIIRVEDTLKALGALAAFYRQKFHIPFIGLTGSVGKTSTKDMISNVLAQRFNMLKTEGNLNNEIGVPLTIFNLDDKHEAAVIEMGMSGLGEISRLTSMVKPDMAIITNVGMAHIEKLGSRQNILKAKLEILEGLDSKGLVILNGDDGLLNGMKDLLKYRTVFYGMDEGADYKAYNIDSYGEKGINFDITVEEREYSVYVPVPGLHNVHNALAAIAVGRELSIPMDEIIKGISEFSPGKMRMNIELSNGIKVINDTYNASPQSMEAAINVLEDISRNSRSIAVLGDMLEMGAWAEDAHSDIGKHTASKNVTYLIAVGKYAEATVNGAINAGFSPDHTAAFGNNQETIEFLRMIVKKGDTLLVKGSRGMKMEELTAMLTENNDWIREE